MTWTLVINHMALVVVLYGFQGFTIYLEFLEIRLGTIKTRVLIVEGLNVGLSWSTYTMRLELRYWILLFLTYSAKFIANNLILFFIKL